MMLGQIREKSPKKNRLCYSLTGDFGHRPPWFWVQIYRILHIQWSTWGLLCVETWVEGFLWTISFGSTEAGSKAREIEKWVNKSACVYRDTQGHFLSEMAVHPGFPDGLVPILLELVHKYLYGFYTIPLMLWIVQHWLESGKIAIECNR